MAGFFSRLGSMVKNNPVSKILQDLSSFGMKYDDMVVRNSRAIGILEDRFGYTQINPLGIENEDYWYPFAALALSDISLKKNISFFDKTYAQKRQELRAFALQDEIEDILDTLCDEAIVYDSKNFFCYPDLMLMTSISEDVKKELIKSFHQIYNYFGFNQDQSAWFYFRKWLIDGYLAFEIIYNDKQDEIIGFKELDPITLVPGIDKVTNKKIWYQYKGNPAKERILFDSQIIYISYSSISNISRVSYVERLVRAFNLLRIMETTRIVWAVMNSSYRLKFIIPVGGKSKTRAKQSLAQLMNNYREIVDFDYNSGTLNVNGKPMMSFNKEYWLPSKDGESPQIETLTTDGPDFNDTDALKYFYDKLKLVSKIPFSRFDRNSPATYELSAEGMIREEIKFDKFINRLRSVFQEILVKPLYIQMCLKFPQFKNDINFKNQISLVYNADNVFSELKEMDLYQKRIDFISNLKTNLTTINSETGEEESYFDLEFLIERFGKFDPMDLEKNREIKNKRKKEQKNKEKEDNEEKFDLNLGI